MNTKSILASFSQNEVFDKNRFREVVHSIYPKYAESSISWLLDKLKKDKQIIATGYGKYRKISNMPGVTHYIYSHSSDYKEIEKFIEERHPLMEFQMWEIFQFNEFVNHQIAKNTIFVEVESMQEDFVFDALHETYPYTLLSPNIDQYHRYRGNELTIVVLKLISEAPKPKEGHSSPLEKLLVDLFTNKLTGHLIMKSEYPAIIQDSFTKYYIDETKMYRYARRRNVELRLKEFIDNETNGKTK